jgi:hypothetical protein
MSFEQRITNNQLPMTNASELEIGNWSLVICCSAMNRVSSSLAALP